MKPIVMLLTGLFISSSVVGIAHAQTAPDAPQYQPGTTQNLDSDFLPEGTTTGKALNGNSQITIPTGDNTYVYGQDASTDPTPYNDAGHGATIGIGTTFGNEAK